MRLIDADKIPWTDLSDGRGLCYVTFLEKVQRLPTVKETPVRHGRWIYYPECLKNEGASHDDAICSVCGEMFDQMDNDVERFDYCPHCGAKMEAEQDE